MADCEFHEDTDFIDGPFIDKEEFMRQKEFEENLMETMLKRPPVDVQLGGKKAILNYIAEMAVELYEGPKNDCDIDENYGACPIDEEEL